MARMTPADAGEGVGPEPADGAEDVDAQVPDAGDVEPDVSDAEVADAGVSDPEPEVETEDAGVADAEAEVETGDAGGEEPAPAGPRWRGRRVVVPAVVAVLSLSLAAVLIVTGRSGGGGDEGGGDLGSLPTMTSTTMDTGGIDVPTPDGWTAAPVPLLDFGIAVPPAWEAAVLRQEMLASLGRSDPAVTGFVEAAHAAAQSGAVFYAAGEDGQGRVTDVKVRAAPETGITDVAGLEAYASELSAASGLADVSVEPVEGAERPTVRTGFTTTSRSPEGEEVTASGSETLVVGPRGLVWSVIVTGEDGDLVADLGPRIFDTLTLVE